MQRTKTLILLTLTLASNLVFGQLAYASSVKSPCSVVLEVGTTKENLYAALDVANQIPNLKLKKIDLSQAPDLTGNVDLSKNIRLIADRLGKKTVSSLLADLSGDRKKNLQQTGVLLRWNRGPLVSETFSAQTAKSLEELEGKARRRLERLLIVALDIAKNSLEMSAENIEGLNKKILDAVSDRLMLQGIFHQVVLREIVKKDQYTANDFVIEILNPHKYPVVRHDPLRALQTFENFNEQHSRINDDREVKAWVSRYSDNQNSIVSYVLEQNRLLEKARQRDLKELRRKLVVKQLEFEQNPHDIRAWIESERFTEKVRLAERTTITVERLPTLTSYFATDGQYVEAGAMLIRLEDGSGIIRLRQIHPEKQPSHLAR